MSENDAVTPRVYLVRHGQTEWAKMGRFTGRTEVELTNEGIKQVTSTARTLVGHGKLLDPSSIEKVFVSPRRRAMKTFELLLGSTELDEGKVTYTEDIREWDYGAYEGLKEPEIRELRASEGLDLVAPWNIWSDGCPGGESMQQITERIDVVISKIKEIHEPHMRGRDEKRVNLVLVSHGLILRCLLKRWLGSPIDRPLEMNFPPGGIAILSYKDNDVMKPNFFVGLALPSEH